MKFEPTGDQKDQTPQMSNELNFCGNLLIFGEF